MLICMTPKEKNKIKHTAHRGFFFLSCYLFFIIMAANKQPNGKHIRRKTHIHEGIEFIWRFHSTISFYYIWIIHDELSWRWYVFESKPNNGKWEKMVMMMRKMTKKHIEIFIERNGCARMNVVNLSGVNANDKFNCRALLMVRLNWIVRSENWYYALVCWREKLPNYSKTSDRIDYFGLCRWIVLRHGYIWLLLLFSIFIVIEHFIYLQFSNCSRSTIISINF